MPNTRLKFFLSVSILAWLFVILFFVVYLVNAKQRGRAIAATIVSELEMWEGGHSKLSVHRTATIRPRRHFRWSECASPVFILHKLYFIYISTGLTSTSVPSLVGLTILAKSWGSTRLARTTKVALESAVVLYSVTAYYTVITKLEYFSAVSLTL